MSNIDDIEIKKRISYMILRLNKYRKYFRQITNILNFKLLTDNDVKTDQCTIINVERYRYLLNLERKILEIRDIHEQFKKFLKK